MVPRILWLTLLLSITAAVHMRSYNKVNYEDLTSKEQLEAFFPDGVASTNLVTYPISVQFVHVSRFPQILGVYDADCVPNITSPAFRGANRIVGGR